MLPRGAAVVPLDEVGGISAKNPVVRACFPPDPVGLLGIGISPKSIRFSSGTFPAPVPFAFPEVISPKSTSSKTSFWVEKSPKSSSIESFLALADFAGVTSFSRRISRLFGASYQLSMGWRHTFWLYPQEIASRFPARLCTYYPGEGPIHSRYSR